MWPDLLMQTVPDSGTIVPNMGTKRPTRTSRKPASLASALFTPVQQRVLGLLFAQPERMFQSAELIRLAGSGTGAAYRVLTRLAASGIVSVERRGNLKYYQANPASPVFAELQGLVVKTVGVVEPLRQALAPMARKIHAAFVYGSVARQADRASSDIDLMVISDTLGYPDLFGALQKAEAKLARTISPNVMTREKWLAKCVQEDSFATRIAAQPKLFIVGSDDDLG